LSQRKHSVLRQDGWISRR